MMNTLTSDGRQLVTLRDSVATLRLMQHRHAPDQAAPRIKVMRGAHQDAGPASIPAHQPSAAECYGCVDWFRF
jgi:hypothetical protein